MKYNSIVKIFILSVVLLSSCAKSEDLDSYEITKTAWDAWIQNNYNTRNPRTFQGYNVEEQLVDIDESEALYYSPIYEGTEDVTMSSDQWVKIKYTGRTMDGSVFVTRYEDEAKKQDTWTTITNYEGQYMRLVVDNEDEGLYSGVPDGLYDAFMSMTKKGQMIRAYVPYYLGWSSQPSFDYGYQGLISLETEMHFFMDIELLEVIDDIEEYEYDKVLEWVANNGNDWTQIYDDSENFEALYYKIGADDPTYEGDEYLEDIEAGSTKMQVYYELWTLGDKHNEDPVLVDTNLLDVAINEWGFPEHIGFAVPYSNTNTTDYYITALNEVIAESYNYGVGVKGGQWVEAVFTSDWAYGEDGLVPDEDTEFEDYSSGNDDDFTYDYYYSGVKTSVVQGYQPLYAKFIAKIYVSDDE